ncbi:MAG TPA: hypothetical protein VK252_08090 [Solirubrobacteraceae bacterium]|nr:hypothetical protein [Solirubrobacteraceae bacterium]
MSLALGTAAIILVVLLWELTRPKVKDASARLRLAWINRWRADGHSRYDPGRELRAEQRARALLRSCIDADDWAMYRDLGLLRVWGRLGERRELHRDGAAARPDRAARDGAPYAYLIYPHKPIVAYVPATGELLNEYCVAFPDGSRPYGSSRLPDSDDVLAKWMALTGDERRLLSDANMHLPGRQVDPDMVRRDLARLVAWDREQASRPAGSVRAA